MKKYKVERLDKDSIIGLDFSEVPYKVDTAGFEPLDCKIKRFMLSGEIAQFSKSMFDSNDYKEMYESLPQIQYDSFDEMEDTKEKVRILIQKRNEIYARKLAAIAAAQNQDNVRVPSNDTVDKPVESVESKESIE